MKILLLLFALLSAPLVMAADQPVTNDVVTNTYRSTKELTVTRKSLGLGSPASMVTLGNEQALFVDDDYYHVPQDMPFYPTAAVIWPRVVDLPCERLNGQVVCEGFHWQPALGRAEYLFVTPRIKEVKPPVLVYVEAPRKKKAE